MRRRFSSHLRPFFGIVGAVSTCLTLGCGFISVEEAAPESADPSPGTDELDADALAALEKISTLGYVDASPEPAAAAQMGVTVFDEERSYPGYNLYTVRKQRAAELIDAGGRVVRRWQRKEDFAWVRSVLLPNGDLLVVGDLPRDPETTTKKTAPHFAMRLNWDNEVIWKRELAAHHDIVLTPDDRIGVLTVEGRRPPGSPPSTILVEDHVTLLGQDGEIEEKRSLEQMLRARPDLFTFLPGGKGRRRWDPLHSNSLRWMTDGALAARDPIYSLGNIIVCFRHQNSVAIFDWEEQEVIWTWGQGDLDEPHDAVVLESGNLLIFDNGPKRYWSRVIELDPLSRKIVWEYKASTPTDFYSGARGGNQRLPNGNTLITESNRGRAFEVTPEGEIVWEYFVPHLNRNGHRQVIVRLYRYEAELIERLLLGSL